MTPANLKSKVWGTTTWAEGPIGSSTENETENKGTTMLVLSLLMTCLQHLASYKLILTNSDLLDLQTLTCLTYNYLLMQPALLFTAHANREKTEPASWQVSEFQPCDIQSTCNITTLINQILQSLHDPASLNILLCQHPWNTMWDAMTVKYKRQTMNVRMLDLKSADLCKSAALISPLDPWPAFLTLIDTFMSFWTANFRDKPKQR